MLRIHRFCINAMWKKSPKNSKTNCNAAMLRKSYFLSKNRLSNLFKLKDCIISHLCSHLFDKFQCSNCNISCYWDTDHHLKVRYPNANYAHIMQLISFYYPWKHQKTSGFLMFSGGYWKRPSGMICFNMKKGQWEKKNAIKGHCLLPGHVFP